MPKRPPLPQAQCLAVLRADPDSAEGAAMLAEITAHQARGLGFRAEGLT